MIFLSATSLIKDSPSKPAVSTSGELIFKVSLNHPEIVLVEDATNEETNAFILSVSYCSPMKKGMSSIMSDVS